MAEQETGEGDGARNAEGGDGGDHVGTGRANGVIQGGQQQEEQQDSGVNSASAAEQKEEGEGRGEEREEGASELRSPAAAAENDDADVVMVSPSDGRAVSDSESGNGDGNDGNAAGADVGAITRRPNLRALMTMLVVSLRMQRLVHWVVRKRCLDGLSTGNLVDLLAALEVKQPVLLQLPELTYT